MKNSIILLFLTILLFNCTDSSNKVSFLSRCMMPKDVTFVNNIVLLFEKQLEKRYESVDYKRFLSEMKNAAISPDFFVKSALNEFLLENSSSSSFQDMWLKQERFYTINPKSAYFKCLAESSDVEPLTKTLDIFKKVQGMSMGLLSQALFSEFSDEDYNSKVVKTFLAVNICAEFAMNLSQF